MRDPAVKALYALHVTAAEARHILAGHPIYRPTWPPQCCQGVVVGLCVDAYVELDGRLVPTVIGEACLVSAQAAPAISIGLWYLNGGGLRTQVEWRFGEVTTYRTPLPHKRGRGMSSPMPEAPMGTLTEVRQEMW